MPESLRWLIMKNRLDDAERLITKVTAVNKIEFPQVKWGDIKLQLGLADTETKQYSVIDILKTPKLRKRSLILFYIWYILYYRF